MILQNRQAFTILLLLIICFMCPIEVCAKVMAKIGDPVTLTLSANPLTTKYQYFVRSLGLVDAQYEIVYSIGNLRQIRFHLPSDRLGQIHLVGVAHSKKTLQRIIVCPRDMDQHNITILDVLGEGGSGVVFDALLNDKRIALKTNTKKDNAISIYKEMKIMMKLVNETLGSTEKRHFLSPLGFFNQNSSFFMIFYPQLDTDIYTANIQDKEELSCEDLTRLARHILTALRQIHAAGIIHNDVKPQNILVDRHDNYFLIDFGLSCFREQPEFCSDAGTFGYFHPVIFTNITLSEKVDLFSFAITMLNVAVGKEVFRLKNIHDHVLRYQAYLLHLTGAMGEPEHNLLKTSVEKGKEANANFNPLEYWNETISHPMFQTCPSILEMIRICMKWNLNEIPSAKEMLERFFPSIRKRVLDKNSLYSKRHKSV